MGEFEVVTICGSMRFFKSHMLDIAAALSMQKLIVLMPFVTVPQENQLTSAKKQMLDRMHFAKIDMSYSIFVVNVNGYIGESTRNEIEYAYDQGKNVRFWSEEFGEF